MALRLIYWYSEMDTEQGNYRESNAHTRPFGMSANDETLQEPSTRCKKKVCGDGDAEVGMVGINRR